ncbi:hypothetical protein [Niabella ginsengisoli]|uniref:Uncharacterized protein n=1 Tax=Niabella ginsengisoli TaxID=522298 RepID=A0ABS9SMY4_9BACT|nr:hypothetical protein [Niabella ginsengisoli]MCH5599712.1 hypothetical protein [Niabella ginsengisoli]
MAIILDADEISIKTYRGYLEKVLFTALAKTMPLEQFIYPAQNKATIALPDNIIATPFPAAKGLFRQKKWINGCVKKCIGFYQFYKNAENDCTLETDFVDLYRN